MNPKNSTTTSTTTSSSAGRLARQRPASLLWIVAGWAAGALVFSVHPARAQVPVSQDQKAALRAVALMTEGQRTYFQKNGAFRATVANIQRDFSTSLPASFNTAVRTTTEAAYSYVIPAQPPGTGSLKAYVGAAFLTPSQNPKITTIICQNIQPGQIRPADPQLVLGTLVANPTGRIVQCGDASIEVPASMVNE